jgi:hypothetical protein
VKKIRMLGGIFIAGRGNYNVCEALVGKTGYLEELWAEGKIILNGGFIISGRIEGKWLAQHVV